MLEKRGDFKLGKSKTDDGSGEDAKVAPNKPSDWIMSRNRVLGGDKEARKEHLQKQGGVDQSSVDIDELLGDL